MIKDYLEYYKKDVKAKYDIEKKGTNSSFLIHPSRAKLRKLCLEIFKSNTNPDDLKSFAFFFGFEFNPENTNKLKDNTDKFRPIETFFKGETDLNDIEAVNLAAILVDFKDRPYLKYSKKEVEKNKELAPQQGEKINEKKNFPIEKEATPQIPKSLLDIPVIPIGKTNTEKENPIFLYIKNHKILSGAVILLIFLSSFLSIKTLIKENQCMTWKKDHFEEIACDEIIGEGTGIVVPKDDYLIQEFRKVETCDTTTFFKNGMPCIWYWKTPNDKLDCFTAPGFHPENKKNLKPITQHMIDKYILRK